MGLFARAPSAQHGERVGLFSDPSLAQTWGLMQGVLPGGMGVPPRRSTEAYLTAYSQMPWLRALTSRIGTATARAGWQLYVIKGKKDPKARAKTARVLNVGTVQTIQRATLETRRKLLKQAKEADELAVIEQHPLLDLLHDANSFQTGFAVRKVTQLHLDIVGDAFWLKERDPQGTIVGVWPLPPHWIVSTPTPAFRFFRVRFRAWGGLIPDTEILWFSDIDPWNPYGRGSGSAMALGDELETDEYAARFTKAFFYNQARPDILVWPKGSTNMTPANVKRLEQDWLANTQGFFRAFRPYFLTKEVEVKELATGNMRSQQFVQLREFERDAILQHYGVPPEILGVLTHSNRSTIESADFFMGKYVVEPRVEFQRQVMQERLVPEYDDRLILDFDSFVQENDERHLEAAKVAPWALSVDEWRAFMGTAPLADQAAGSLHMVPTLMTPQSLSEPSQPSLDQPPPTPGGDETPQRSLRGIALRGLPGVSEHEWADSLSVAAEAGDVVFAELFAKALKVPDDLPAVSATAARMEASLSRRLVRAWKAHRDVVDIAAIERGLVAHGVHGDIVDALELSVLGSTQSHVLVPALETGVLSGAEHGARALRRYGVAVRRTGVPSEKAPIAVDLRGVNPLATQWAHAHAAELVQASNDAREMIRLLVAESNESGIPVAELAKAIRLVVGLTPKQALAVARFKGRLLKEGLAIDVVSRRVERYAEAQLRYRAMTIARTELIAALNVGQQMLWNQAISQGAIRAEKFLKHWIITDDDLLDKEGICEGNAEDDVPMDEVFASGDEHPPAHVACRCSMGLVEAEKSVKPAPKIEVQNHIEASVPAQVTVHNVLPPLTIHQDAPTVAATRRTRVLQYDDLGRVIGVIDTEEAAP